MVEGFKQLGFDKPKVHHIHPNDIPKDKPVYCVIRNPVTWALAYYADFWPHKSFTTFITEKLQGMPWVTDRMHVYYNEATFCYPYELGLERIFSFMGYPKVSLPKIGNHDTIRDEMERSLPNDYRKLILKKFHQDHRIYMQQAYLL